MCDGVCFKKVKVKSAKVYCGFTMSMSAYNNFFFFFFLLYRKQEKDQSKSNLGFGQIGKVN